MNILLPILVFLIAALYSSAGFGGASGYLLAMSFFDIPNNVMASTPPASACRQGTRRFGITR